MNKKINFNFIKVVAFLLLTFLMISSTLRVFNYKDMGGGGGWQRFYAEEDEKIDVIFFGSSHAHCTIDHGYLWDNYGIAGYTLSAGSQQIDSTRYFVEEALKRQKPKVIVVEAYGMIGDTLSDSREHVYRNTLGMKWSSGFGKYIGYLTSNMEMEQEERLEVFFKIPVIHSRYSELAESDFRDNIPFMRGYRGSFERVSLEEPEAAEICGEMALNPQKLVMIQEMINVANNYGIPIVFFASPYALTEGEQMQFNSLEAFARQQGIPFINYNKMYGDLLIDFETDFRDVGHVNNYGAVKVTDHIAQYLKNNYGLPDRRGDANYKLWEENALYLRNKILRHDLKECKDINEYFQCLSEISEEQLIIIALTGNYNALGDVYLNQLKQFGISDEEYAAGGVFIFDGTERKLYLQGKEYSHCIHTANGEIHVQSEVHEIDGEEKDEVKLLFNGKNYVMVENGVNIIVYNESINQLIDIAGDDIYLGLEMVHGEMEEE